MNTNTFNLLNTELSKINFSLSPEQLSQLGTYATDLISYNAHTNLISREIKHVDDLMRRHFLDSLSLLEFWDELIDSDRHLSSPKLADIGSGAGFPGLCLAIAKPELEVVLIDSVGKKTEFLSQIVKKLGLESRVTVELGRAEEIGHEKPFREKFSIVTSRALSSMAVVAELGLPLLKLGGCLVTYKSRVGLSDEIEAAQAPVGQFGGDKAQIQIPSLQDDDKRHCLVFIAKKKPTPLDYPRPWAKIIKKRN